MKKILLIEDNDDLRENTAEILTLANYTVFTADNGKIGVEIALKELPDIIICDIMMPILDGYGTLHLLSKNPITANIPFIFLTAKADQIDFRKGMEMGADDYITKPFDDIQLLNAIEVRLKKNEVFKKIQSVNANKELETTDDITNSNFFEKLSQENELREYKKKSIIYKEGVYAKGVYFIGKGKVKTYRTNEFGKELITGLFNQGEFFGHISVLKNEPYDETAAALEDAEIYMITKDEFLAIIYKNTEISKKVISLLSSDIIETQKKLIQFAYDSVRKRIADALIALFNKYNNNNEATLTLNIGREDIANMVGTATETVTRVLTDFRQEKLIDVSGIAIIILNIDKLKKVRN